MRRGLPSTLAGLSAVSYVQRNIRRRLCRRCAGADEVVLNPLILRGRAQARSVREQKRFPASFRVHTTEGNLMKALIAILLGMSVISLTACNTVSGAGKDVQATGKAVEKAADESKPK
jgi:entericidin B